MFKWRIENKSTCYDLLLKWWGEQNAFEDHIITYESLPNRIFIVSNEEDDLFAVPLYITDSNFCYIGWVTGNPKIKPMKKAGALEFLYDIISISMKSQGYSYIFSKADARSLQRVASKTGYVNSGETVFYIKKL